MAERVAAPLSDEELAALESYFSQAQSPQHRNARRAASELQALRAAVEQARADERAYWRDPENHEIGEHVAAMERVARAEERKRIRQNPCQCDPPGSGEEMCTEHCYVRLQEKIDAKKPEGWCTAAVAQARVAERARIVAWLRYQRNLGGSAWFQWAADQLAAEADRA